MFSSIYQFSGAVVWFTFFSSYTVSFILSSFIHVCYLTSFWRTFSIWPLIYWYAIALLDFFAKFSYCLYYIISFVAVCLKVVFVSGYFLFTCFLNAKISPFSLIIFIGVYLFIFMYGMWYGFIFMYRIH